MKKTLLALMLIMAIAGCKDKAADTPIAAGAAAAGGDVPQVSMGGGDSEVKLLQDIVRKDPKNVDAYIKLGNVYMDNSRFPEAVECYSKALAIDPNNADVRVDMGSCYRRIGRSETAVQEYKKAIASTPNHLNAHLNLAVVLGYDFNDAKGAIAEFEKYLALAPNAPNAPAIRQEIEKFKSSAPQK